MPRNRYFRARDPYWLNAKFASGCGNSSCPNQIRKGDRIFYYPNGRKALCPACSETAGRDFDAAKQDEAFMQGQFPGGHDPF